jgi:hypothetical protein
VLLLVEGWCIGSTWQPMATCLCGIFCSSNQQNKLAPDMSQQLTLFTIGTGNKLDCMPAFSSILGLLCFSTACPDFRDF